MRSMLYVASIFSVNKYNKDQHSVLFICVQIKLLKFFDMSIRTGWTGIGHQSKPIRSLSGLSTNILRLKQFLEGANKGTAFN